MKAKEIYLDNAATTSCLPEAADIIKDILVNKYGNPSSAHLKGVESEEILDKARADIAERIRCKDKEIIFTSGGTESNNMAIFGSVQALSRGGKRRHIITSEIEHSSVYNSIKELENQGYDVTYIPVDDKGMVRLDSLYDAIQKDTILVSIMHVNNETGVVQPIEEIGNIIMQRSDRCAYHVDAVQSMGKIPISLSRTHIDLLSASSHKFHGPKGCGFLYKREGAKLNPIIFGGGQERGLRSGTVNVPSIAAMAHAFSFVTGRNDVMKDHMILLKEQFTKGLLNLPKVYINGYIDEAKNAGHIINVRFSGVKSEVMVHALEDKGIYASNGSACSSHSKKVNRTLKAMGLSDEEAGASVRFSFSMHTTKEDIDYTLDVMEKLLPKLRKFSER